MKINRNKQIEVTEKTRGEVFGGKLKVQTLLISAYRTAEERGAVLAAIVKSSDDAIITKDLNGMVTSWTNQQNEYLAIAGKR